MLCSSPFISRCPRSVHFPADRVEIRFVSTPRYFISGCVTIKNKTESVSSFNHVLIIIFTPLSCLLLFARTGTLQPRTYQWGSPDILCGLKLDWLDWNAKIVQPSYSSWLPGVAQRECSDWLCCKITTLLKSKCCLWESELQLMTQLSLVFVFSPWCSVN